MWSAIKRFAAAILITPLLVFAGVFAWLAGAGTKPSPEAFLVGSVLLVVVGIPIVLISCAIYICLALVIIPVDMCIAKVRRFRQRSRRH
ncbi:hypothetical protein SAMN04488515_0849 [Cognatiyoonia koreensis]|uniref:Uncharacterized protein n=1 Tax=Cognatiyoonia koreensis TaxID=364200 RepID=A0A1I0NVL2_9RHOB|nr:hypothetical protein [Cognatiyoonia koreensis]SEW05702.1 hypothetical protein SAMN04488515_0849 [Cognatiyoonia koreensis]